MWQKRKRKKKVFLDQMRDIITDEHISERTTNTKKMFCMHFHEMIVISNLNEIPIRVLILQPLVLFRYHKKLLSRWMNRFLLIGIDFISYVLEREGIKGRNVGKFFHWFNDDVLELQKKILNADRTTEKNSRLRQEVVNEN
ncbi:hypothetical protein LOAG_08978 [Loa loa]|uniref:Uncharacterized protein n=1 Tax=Loa loa TaxID=7209 RepID=A0A1S0TSR3_LOALO|nr:hypothetical protein LOAG_08978 [Loa loa]EFO19514.1 hypothetical protein LOAG_08978 [Loa loa]